METKKRNIVLGMRYFIYFIVLTSILLSENFNADEIVLLIAYFLLYIINIHIRIHFLKKCLWGIMGSLVIEMFLIFQLYGQFGGFIFIYSFLMILDATIMLPKKHAYIMLSLIYGFVILQSRKPLYYDLSRYNTINMVFNTLFVLIFGSLGRYIYEQERKTNEAHILYDELRRSEEKLQEAYRKLEGYSNTIEELTILRERNRISREIHDTVGHTLTTLIMQMQALPFVMNKDMEQAEEMLGQMILHTKRGLEDVRRAVKELKPTDFDQYAGIFAIQELIEQFKKNSTVEVRFRMSKEQYVLSPDQSFTLYRVIQEAMNNAVRHGKATEIDILMNFTPWEIIVQIKDNGVGKKTYDKGFGITNMEERLLKLGGKMRIHTEENRGFEVNIILPKGEGKDEQGSVGYRG